MYSDPDYNSKPLEFMSREEKYEEGLRRASLAIWKKDEVSDFVSTPRDLHEYNKLVFLSIDIINIEIN